MRSFPYKSAGNPDLRTPGRYLLWLAGAQRGTLLLAIVYGSIWTLCQAFTPYILGQAIDQGILPGDFGRLSFWVGLLVALTLLQSVTATLRFFAAGAGGGVGGAGASGADVDVDGAAAASADAQGAEREVTFRGHRAPPTLNEHGAAIRSWIAERQISGVR